MWTCDPVRVITRLIAGLDVPYAANFLYLFYIHHYMYLPVSIFSFIIWKFLMKLVNNMLQKAVKNRENNISLIIHSHEGYLVAPWVSSASFLENGHLVMPWPLNISISYDYLSRNGCQIVLALQMKSDGHYILPLKYSWNIYTNGRQEKWVRITAFIMIYLFCSL